MGDLVLLSEQGEGIVQLSLNDAATRNAMSESMAAEFSAHIAMLKARADLRVVVLTGEGQSFSGGGHLDMLFEKTKLSQAENERRMMEFYSHFLRIRELAVPVVAALNGHAIGAGLCLALACDIRIASEAAKLGVNFVHLGLHPGMGATYFLPRIVGPAQAAELLFTGRIISATDACEIGLVHQVHAVESFQTELAALTRGLAHAGPAALRAVKASLRMSAADTLEECLQREAKCQAVSYGSAEFLEGISAAKEKRPPRFKAADLSCR